MSATTKPGDWVDGFLFVGNQLALDFINTRPLIEGEFTEFLPDLPALLRWFKAAGLITSRDQGRLAKKWQNDSSANRFPKEVRDFREMLRADVVALESGQRVRGSTLRELDLLLAEHPMRKRIDADNLLTEPWFPIETPDDFFAPLAQAAAELFTEADRTRIRQCGACVLHFLDTSKKGTRRWCSMNLCGNRSKVAAYAERKRLAP
jgi:predicted RNA-binding Zn ribbon-like protein